MGIKSYSELQDTMTRFLKRADLKDLLPDFIMLAEQHFNRKIFTRARRATFQFTPSKYTVQLPPDWDRLIAVYYGGHPLKQHAIGEESAYAGGQAQLMIGGFQINGDTLAFGADQLGQVLRIDYYSVIEPLSETNESNWLLEDAPDIYLFGALHEAAVYVRDDARATVWMQKRDLAIDELTAEDDAAKAADQPLVMRSS
ncbi:hypothetical protein DN523_10145 [Burkholderia multivorans]|uniref:phage adaptor protein n=1 Tax=Burkholderia multivorans TaxID=87883 RepID=UPI000DAE25F3|nr:hypothetical protein [Burkholderia multivorans]MBR7922685.1 hypothetical protein [Burkholderia multivorans]MBU9440074.1 hypothetical protein [Burkholderia multivorans]RAA25203.1 hypothetical protein DN471_17355 [Burkholderia multivorans]RAA27532.1 hypothetical protein DN470_10555 [Burkholderia multivorans]RAA36575.1 hypothetical protein DN465_07750 [Burkholderia multivorans]